MHPAPLLFEKEGVSKSDLVLQVTNNKKSRKPIMVSGIVNTVLSIRV